MWCLLVVLVVASRSASSIRDGWLKVELSYLVQLQPELALVDK